MNIDSAYYILKPIEGGLSLNPNDNGNWTGGKTGVGNLIGSNIGISAPVLCTKLGRLATSDDMKNLTDETAKSIYETEYWIPANCDKIKKPELCYTVFDTAVNMGVGTAIKLLQMAGNCKVIDSLWGAETLIHSDNITLGNYLFERICHYIDIVSNDPSQDIFIYGWANRCKTILNMYKEGKLL